MFIMIISSVINIYFTIEYRSTMPQRIQSIVNNSIKVNLPNFTNIITDKVNMKVNSLNLRNGIDGYTPQLGVDYFNGKDGQDSISTNTIIVEKTIEKVPINGQNGLDGKTVIPRCNTGKNRWEISYNNGLNWQPMLDELNKTVKCTL